MEQELEKNGMTIEKELSSWKVVRIDIKFGMVNQTTIIDKDDWTVDIVTEKVLSLPIYYSRRMFSIGYKTTVCFVDQLIHRIATELENVAQDEEYQEDFAQYKQRADTTKNLRPDKGSEN